jgi:hypothetical protein
MEFVIIHYHSHNGDRPLCRLLQKSYLICDNYFIDLWINQISTGNLVKPSNYWCFNWFMTPKSLLIRLNDLIIRWMCKCVWSWIYFSGAICTVVCPHCENDNEWKQTPCSFIVYEPKIKEIYSFFLVMVRFGYGPFWFWNETSCSVDTDSHKLKQLKVKIIICQTSNQSATMEQNYCSSKSIF